MAEIIPFFNEHTSFSMEVSLEEKPYSFLFTYNARGDFWTMSMFDLEANLILAGIKVVINYELISIFNHLEIPKGFIFTLDTTRKELRVNRENMGSVINLVYSSEGEE